MLKIIHLQISISNQEELISTQCFFSSQKFLADLDSRLLHRALLMCRAEFISRILSLLGVALMGYIWRGKKPNLPTRRTWASAESFSTWYLVLFLMRWFPIGANTLRLGLRIILSLGTGLLRAILVLATNRFLATGTLLCSTSTAAFIECMGGCRRLCTRFIPNPYLLFGTKQVRKIK